MTNALEGTRELEQKLRALGSAFAVPIMRSALRFGIRPAFKRAQQTIPVGKVAHRTYKGRLVAPGFAKRSLRVVTRVSKDKRTFSAALGVRKEAFYAVQFIEREMGNSKQSASPWLRPAFRMTGPQQLQALADRLRDRINKVAKK
jgi:hypothetical protein